MVERLAESAERAEKNNVAFTAHFLLGHLERCLNILINTDRLPEAAFFARSETNTGSVQI
jgi:coatomer subunit beta'